jgi:hypothetical protein
MILEINKQLLLESLKFDNISKAHEFNKSMADRTVSSEYKAEPMYTRGLAEKRKRETRSEDWKERKGPNMNKVPKKDTISKKERSMINDFLKKKKKSK